MKNVTIVPSHTKLKLTVVTKFIQNKNKLREKQITKLFQTICTAFPG